MSGPEPELRADAGSDTADALVDEILADDVDWQRLVRTYPASAVLVAFGGGLWLGYRHGSALLAAATGLAARELTRRVNELLGDEVL